MHMHTVGALDLISNVDEVSDEVPSSPMTQGIDKCTAAEQY